MNGSRVFFDTNVILYMYADGDQAKQAKAKDLFQQYAQSGRMLVSTQVVQEFYSVGSKKFGMPRPKMKEIVASLLRSPLVVLGPSEIVSAIQIEERYNISFWDALILAAAESGGAEVLYTEDLNDGQQYGPVMVRNPFRASTI